MMMSLTQSISFKNMEDMLGDRNAEDRGRYYLCDCPSCNEHEAFIYKNNPKMIQCNRENECGDRFYVNYESVKDVNDVKVKHMKVDYPDLTEDQVKSLDWARRAFKYAQEHFPSPTLDAGFRGLSPEVSRKYIVDFVDEDLVGFMYQKMSSLWDKDYMNNSFMKERNLILPIHDEKGNVDRILLRSSINPDADPKEVQLITNPSKESRDFFMDLNGGSNEVVITEALFDSLSFKEVDRNVNFLSLTGVTKTRQLMNYMKANKKAFFDKTIVVAMDNDRAGKNAEQEILSFLDKEGIGCVRTTFEYPEGFAIDDPNDFLKYDKKMFLESYRRSVQYEKAREVELAL